MIDSILGRNNFFVNIKALDAEGSMIINAFRKNYWVKKSDNYIHFVGGDYKDKRFHAIQTSNIVIAPEFSIKNNDVEIISKTGAFDWVRFYEEGQEIARWRSRAKERYKTYIKNREKCFHSKPFILRCIRTNAIFYWSMKLKMK